MKIIKKIVSIITLSCIIFFTSMNIKSEIKYTQIGKDIAYCYGIFLLGSLVHEFGHWLTGKIIHRCNGFFYVTPFGEGTTYLYYNPTNKELIKEILKKEYLDENYHFTQPLKMPTPHPLVYAAGPLFGIGLSFLVPILNTFFHEYKLDPSVLGALTKTVQQPYFHNKQNFGLIMGALFSLAFNINNLSPFRANTDGNKILKYFNIHCSTNTLKNYAFALVISILCNKLFYKSGAFDSLEKYL